jgi:hypothetical protein
MVLEIQLQDELLTILQLLVKLIVLLAGIFTLLFVFLRVRTTLLDQSFAIDAFRVLWENPQV